MIGKEPTIKNHFPLRLTKNKLNDGIAAFTAV